MVRRALLAALVLSGCANSRYVEHPITAWFTASDAPTPMSAASANPAQKHCRELARQRKSDADMQGEDEPTQNEVYRRSLAQCLDWDARHASPR